MSIVFKIRGALASQQTVMLLPIQGIAVSDAIRQRAERELRKQLPQFGLRPLPAEKAQQALQAIETLGLSCDLESSDCILQVGALAAANVVIAATISHQNQADMLDFVAFDVGGASLVGRTTMEIHPKARIRKKHFYSALTSIFRPDDWVGFTELDVAQPGATIVVDGLLRGFAPISKPLRLQPGEHQLHVVLEGFQTHHEKFNVQFGRTLKMKIKLQPGESEDIATLIRQEPLPAQSATAVPISRGENPPNGPSVVRVAMYRPTVEGVDPRTANILARYVTAELRKRESLSVIGPDEMANLLPSANTAEESQECSEDACFSEIADALGADAIVLMQVTSVGGEVFVGLRRIHPRNQELVASYRSRVAEEDILALLPLVGESVEQLFPNLGIRPGEIKGVDERAKTLMVPPPVPRWVTLGIFGISTVALIPLTVGTVSAFGAQAAYNERIAEANAKPAAALVSWGELESHRSLKSQSELTAFSALGVALVSGGAGAFLALFTDWEELRAIEAE